MKEYVTVKDILKLNEFSEFKVIAGFEGLNNYVGNIVVMDSPDPFPWSLGGEIILSSGYIFKIHENEFSDILRKMKESNMAALFIKVKRYFNLLPEEVIKTANEIGFPIIEVPSGFSFTEVINPTLSKIINDQNEIIMISESIHKEFTQLVINDSDTAKIIDSLSKILNEGIIYFDLYTTKSYTSTNLDKKKSLDNYSINNLLERFESKTIGNKDKIYGYLIFVNNNKGEKIDNPYEAISHANTALILDVQKKISSMQIKDKHKNEFVQDLLMNNIKNNEEVKIRASLYGWNLDKQHFVMNVDIDDFKVKYLNIENNEYKNNLVESRENIMNTSIQILKKYFDFVIYATYSDSIVFILKNNSLNIKHNIEKSTEEIREKVLEKYNFTVTIGISSVKENILELQEAYKESKLSIKIGRALFKRNSTVTYNELGVYKLLYSVYDNKDVKQFYENTLGKLIEYDKKHNSDLINTLDVILENDWNLKNASKALFIHYNTLKYRYKKICDILDIDLNRSESKLNISLALKIYQMTK